MKADSLFSQLDFSPESRVDDLRDGIRNTACNCETGAKPGKLFTTPTTWEKVASQLDETSISSVRLTWCESCGWRAPSPTAQRSAILEPCLTHIGPPEYLTLGEWSYSFLNELLLGGISIQLLNHDLQETRHNYKVKAVVKYFRKHFTLWWYADGDLWQYDDTRARVSKQEKKRALVIYGQVALLVLEMQASGKTLRRLAHMEHAYLSIIMEIHFITLSIS
ncbi:hypothetical protein BKA80DRAFT_316178 [Phyllosticta citrichinensis]